MPTYAGPPPTGGQGMWPTQVFLCGAYYEMLLCVGMDVRDGVLITCVAMYQ